MILEEFIRAIAPYIIHFLEIIGIFIIIESAIRVFSKYLKDMKKPDKRPLKIEFAEAVSFALDFKLASEIIKTVVIRGMNELVVLGAVVGLRVVLTLVLQWEIKAGTSQGQGNQNNNQNAANQPPQNNQNQQTQNAQNQKPPNNG